MERDKGKELRTATRGTILAALLRTARRSRNERRYRRKAKHPKRED